MMIQRVKRESGKLDDRLVGLIAGVAALAIIFAVVMFNRTNESAMEDPVADPAVEVVEADSNPHESGEQLNEALKSALAEEAVQAVAEVSDEPTLVNAEADFVDSVEDAEQLEGLLVYVRDAESKEPIAGAQVMFHDLRDWYTTQGFPEAEYEFTTNEEGAFSLPERFANGSPIIGYTLIAQADGYVSKAFILQSSIVSGTPDENRVISLQAGGVSIRGEVVDEDGRTIANALLGTIPGDFKESSNFTLFHSEGFSLAVSNSDSAGRFELPGLPSRKTFCVIARAEGYLPAVETDVDTETDARIVLSRGEARLHGRVTEGGADPVSGAQIMLMSTSLQSMTSVEGENKIARAMTGMFVTKSDGDGNYVFDALPKDTFHLMAMRGDSNDYSWGNAINKQVTLIRGDDKELNLNFPGAITVLGKVINEDTGDGMSDVRISAEPFVSNKQDGNGNMISTPRSEAEMKNAGVVVSDAKGEFKLSVHPHGNDSGGIYADPPIGWIVEDGKNSKWFNIPQDATEIEVTLKASRGAVLRGQVLDAANQAPVAGAWLTVWIGKDRNFNSIDNVPTSDGDGRFELSVPKNCEVHVRAKYGSIGVGSALATIPAEGDPEEIQILLEPFAEVSGFVTGPEFEKLEGVTIDARTPIQFNDQNIYAYSGSAQTDAQGYYYINNVEPGSVQVTATHPLSERWRSNRQLSDEEVLKYQTYIAPPSVELEFKPGEYNSQVDFQFTTGIAFEGYVKDPEGNPIANANIYADVQRDNQQNYNNRNIQSDEEGHFVVPGMEVDSVINWLSINHNDYEGDGLQALTMEDSPIEIILRPRGMTVLIVREETGETPVVKYRYRLLQSIWTGRFQPANNSTTTSVSNEEGKKELGKLGTGRYRVEVLEEDGDGGLTGRRGVGEFNLPGETDPLEVVVRVNSGRDVYGTVVTGEDKTPVAEAKVYLMRPVDNAWRGDSVENEDFDIVATSDAQGDFVLPSVPYGSHQLFAEKDQMRTAQPMSFEVEPDVNPDPLEIVLAQGGAVYGLVTQRDGTPLAQGTVSCWLTNTGGANQKEAIVDQDGQYRIEDLLPGEYNMQFNYHPDGIYRNVQITIETSGQEVEQNFDFSGAVRLTGEVFVNGEPYDRSQGIYLVLEPVDNDDAWAVSLNFTSENKYSVIIPPGKFRLNLYSNNFGGSIGEEIVLTPSPEEQTHDFHIDLVEKADLVVLFPEGEEFQRGRCLIYTRGTDGKEHQIAFFDMFSTIRTLPNLIPSEYKATFNSQDIYLGESEWTSIGAGQENIIVIPIESFDEMEERTFELTVTLAPGTYEYKYYSEPDRWEVDPLNPVSTKDGQYTNSVFKIPGGAIDDEGNRQPWPRVNDDTGEVTFYHKRKTDKDDLWVRGTFNNWGLTDQYKMKRIDQNP